jgi:hypothetical protein
MLLPQSSAFAALKNRLNSVSAIGLLHTPASMPTSARPSYVHLSSSSPFHSSTGSVGLAPPPSPPLSTASHSGFNFFGGVGGVAGGASVGAHARARSTDKPLPLGSIGSLTSSSSMAGSIAGGTTSNIGGVSTSSSSSVPGRLQRPTARDAASGGDTVRWPELLEKFRGTQEKARRRNERIMRGEAAGGGLDALGGGPATRSLLALGFDESGAGTGGGSGRNSRNSNNPGGEGPVSAGGSGAAGGRAPWARPSSGLGRPIGPPGGLKIPGGGGGSYQGGSGGGSGHEKSGSQGSIGFGSAGGGLGGPTEKGHTHKQRHSLVGKFTSGIARSAGSRERDRDKDKDKGRK